MQDFFHQQYVCNPVNDGIFTISTGEFTGFLNHQQYHFIPSPMLHHEKLADLVILSLMKVSTRWA